MSDDQRVIRGLIVSIMNWKPTKHDWRGHHLDTLMFLSTLKMGEDGIELAIVYGEA